MAGNAGEVLAGSRRFLDAWERSGRQRAPHLGMTAAAVAMIHGLRGDDDARAEWLAIVEELGVTPEGRTGYGHVGCSPPPRHSMPPAAPTSGRER